MAALVALSMLAAAAALAVAYRITARRRAHWDAEAARHVEAIRAVIRNDLGEAA